MMIETENNFLDISKLLSGEVKEISFDLELGSRPFEESGIDVSSLRFSGRAFDQSGFLRLYGTVSGEYSAPCARCLAPVREPFSTEIDFPITTDAEGTEEDCVLAEGQKIDLGVIFEETLYINLPLRLLCQEDCKGLCPKCGKNLNTDSCECTQKEIDPRLAGLADFFKE